MNNYLDNNSLTLNLGFPTTTTTQKTTTTKPQQTNLEPTLTLSLLSAETSNNKNNTLEEPPCSAISSLSNVVMSSVKRERETASSDDVDIERGCSRVSDEDEDAACLATATRKKLRLNKQQSAMLEDSFKQQSTLNPKQKQALAERLNLRPRQVEVWFQNRRARTKLKQTEVDYEYLKKFCESLTDENRRLEKELHELKALKLSAPPFYMHLPAATLTMCPSCERVGGAAAPNMAGTTVTGVTKNMFSVGPKTQRFIAPLLVDN